MIRILHYEPQGQHQRFEPYEHRYNEEQRKHTHLHLHLHLNFRRHQERFSPLSTIHLTRILAALVGATYIVFWWISLLVENDWAISWPSHFAWPWHILLAGLAIAWGAMAIGGLPLLVSAWRSTPHVRFLLVLPFLLLLLFPLAFLLGPVFPFLGPLALLLNGALILVPLVSTILLVGALRQAVIADTWLRFASRLSFVVVGAIALLLLGGLLWYLTLTFLQIAPMDFPWLGLLLSLLGLCITLLVAISAILHWPHWRERAQARPKDEPPS